MCRTTEFSTFKLPKFTDWYDNQVRRKTLFNRLLNTHTHTAWTSNPCLYEYTLCNWPKDLRHCRAHMKERAHQPEKPTKYDRIHIRYGYVTGSDQFIICIATHRPPPNSQKYINRTCSCFPPFGNENEKPTDNPKPKTRTECLTIFGSSGWMRSLHFHI